MSISRPLKVKVVTVGDSGVGKTSILLRIDGNEFSPKVISSVGASFVSARLKHNDRDVVLQLWDTAGQERFRSMVPLYIRNAKAAILVFDISNRDSFENIPAWIRELRKSPSSAEIQLFILMANKVDLENRVVEREEGEKMAEEVGASYFETSAKDGTGIQNAIDSIGELVVGTFTETQPSMILQPLEHETENVATSKGWTCCGFF